MKAEDIKYWKGEITRSRKARMEDHEVWRRLLDSYSLKIAIPNMKQERIVRFSRMYPIVRQILASVSFRYPKLYVQPKPLVEMLPGTDYSAIHRISERAANEALRLMKAKPEIQMALFDTLFCGVGWIKQGFNPIGNDAIPPYVSNDAMREDFSCVMRRDPFKVSVDPDCEPQSIGYAGYVIEEIIAPWKYVRADSRFDKLPKDFTPGAGVEDKHGRLGEDFDEDRTKTEAPMGPDDATNPYRKVRLYEIHNRYDRDIYTFIEGFDEPIRERRHPFANVTGVSDDTGQIVALEEAPGCLFINGSQYIPLKFDLSSKFYPQPPLQYIEDLQNLVIESLSRRADALKRFARIVFVEEQELAQNPELKTQLDRAEDGDIVVVKNNNAVREADWGTVPSDQLGIEADSRQYEEQSLHVRQLTGESSSRETATKTAVVAAQGSLNKEWMQDAVAEAYVTIAHNNFAMWRDPRYLPQQFIQNIAHDNAEFQWQVLTSADFNYEYVLTVEAGSMHPFIEEQEQQNMILLYDRLIGSPLIDHVEVTKDLIRSFRKETPERWLKGAGAQDAIMLAKLEVDFFIIQGQNPPVEAGQDHQLHMEHQNPDAITQHQQFQQMMPQQQQTVIQVATMHVQQHMEMLQQPIQQGGSQPAVDGRLLQGQSDLESTVRSNAQEVSQVTNQEATTLNRQGGG